MGSQNKNNKPASLDIDDGRIRLGGEWNILGLDGVDRQLRQQRWPQGQQLVVDGSRLTALDTAGAWLLKRTIAGLRGQGRQVGVEGLSRQAQELLALIPETLEEKLPEARPPWLAQFGMRVHAAARQHVGLIAFLGETSQLLVERLVRPGRIRGRLILHNVATAGYMALPIVGLLSFLLGVVIAYQAGIQLRLYGGNIYIADLVGFSMLRELAPLITAIIVAGRTGSAYAAQIGTMIVTEEVDALRTMGVSPVELLVLPKLIALVIALPLLTIFANAMGLLGGILVAQGLLGISPGSFLARLADAVPLSSYLVGVGKSPVFAAIIALVGCYRGFRVTSSAESVGQQTTASVVQAIFLVIVIDAAFSIVFSEMGI